ncbi:MAG: signal peptidase I [Candidatus Omnitrophica bacterium]|nr:signal peptidase I [Candidatus Omnitrophota bacterium]MDD5670821.1 signal peptidase I [Candidatus Omnitrophota bacterium]
MMIWSVLIVLALVLFYRKRIVQKMNYEWHYFSTERKAWFKEKWKNWGEPLLVAAILAFLIRSYVVGPYKIPTGSMRPTFLEGDRIFVDKVTYHFKKPMRGDIIVFKYPLDKKKDFVKRLAGLPGEHLEIRDGKLLVNNEAVLDPPFSEHYYYNREDWKYGREREDIVVPPNSYFVLGDNSAQSSDSRNWGFVPCNNVVGKAFVIWWPVKRVKLVN